MDKAQLEALLDRVEKATGPDREIDIAVGFHVDGWETPICPTIKILTFAVTHNGLNIPTYSASIDAALALVERVLPGWVVSDLSQNSRHAGDPWGCELAIYFGSKPSMNRSAFSGFDYNAAPLAIIAALLKALIAQEATCAS